nr:TRIC cation channel family protein [Runella sp.]
MSLPYSIDMIGVLVFAISGALAASDKKMYQDLFGVFLRVSLQRLAEVHFAI